MQLPLYQIDAFATTPFSGNPAAVCPLEHWLPDHVLQQIASENNLSETAFYVSTAEGYSLRWFTPVSEVDLCGHATLATAFVIKNYYRPDIKEIFFHTQSGLVSVSSENDLFTLHFPSRPPQKCTPEPALITALGKTPLEILKSRDYFVVYEKEEIIRELQPDYHLLAKLNTVGIIVTAPGDSSEIDFVSRFFAPGEGILEDPVTGSAHCTLIPYWAQKLSKKNLHAKQLSRRGGELFCIDHGQRVDISGYCVPYLKGTIQI